ncbi:MAG TPA: MBL fold metallo-hydrolase [Anaerolineaceae bacterium]
MKLTFLGTSAATSYPLPFCMCQNCQQAKMNGGKDIRKRSSLLINADLVIDMGPDFVTSCFLYQLDPAQIRYALQTHPHSDHFDASILTTRAAEYAAQDVPLLSLCASKQTIEKMSEMMQGEGYVQNLLDRQDQKRLNIDVFPLELFQTIQMGQYRFTAYPTDHDPAVGSCLYSVTEGAATIFYGTDTVDLTEEVWRSFHTKGEKFNCVILDQTYGLNVNGGGHLNANQVLALIDRMKKENLLAPGAQIFATHISHEGNPPHAVLSEEARRIGYDIAYDGLVLTI